MLQYSKNKMMESHKSTQKKPVFIVIGLIALAIIAQAIVLSLPFIQVGLQRWQEYLDLQWAHQENLIQVLINFSLMLWLSSSAFYFGGWLLHRSIRKLMGKSWSLETHNAKRKKFFPPILPYLKLSCLYLMVVLIFVMFQYPLQFILYTH